MRVFPLSVSSRVLLRSLLVQGSWNYETLIGTGFAFTIVPVLELWLLIEIGKRMGAWTSVGLVIVTGILGSALAKREALSDAQRAAAAQALARRGLPFAMLPGVVVLVFQAEHLARGRVEQ